MIRAGVSKNYAMSVCKLGQGEHCCRYLVADGEGLACAKFLVDLKAHLDDRVAKQTISARGDNCPGVKPTEATGAVYVTTHA